MNTTDISTLTKEEIAVSDREIELELSLLCSLGTIALSAIVGIHTILMYACPCLLVG